jgi:signal transduction histidine kinase/CheY-like chemotaxis protein
VITDETKRAPVNATLVNIDGHLDVHDDIENRFGLVPNFFRLSQDPQILANLWGFACFAYLDNPLTSLFKERLFVYVSRFCEVRYCIARHVGFLVGLGRPSGDAACAIQSVDEVLDLIRRPLPRGEGLQPALSQCEACESPLLQLPAPDSAMEQALFACATHVFLQSPDATRCLRALERSLGEPQVQYLTLLLAFVRTAHFWTKTHEDLNIEEDVIQLLKTHETLASCVLNDPEATSSVFSAYEALREADRRKGEFLAMLAHELRNPLAAIGNAAQILLRSGGDAPTVQAAAGILDRQVRHMVRQVDDLLDVSRISQGKIELRKERTNMVRVVDDAVESARPQLERSGHELTVTLPLKAVYVHGDPIRLTQVVGNVLNNASKFTANDGRIWLTVEAEGEQAVVRVRDTGEGIAPEQLGRIFEMFAQVKTPLESSHSGLGIGLTLVKSLVEMHGGTVEARSAGVGHGSEFVIHLPLLPGAQAMAQEPAVGPSVLTRARRVLVVDDNRDSADSLATLLKLTGHDVYTANDGFEAVDAASMLQPDVILMDIGMPRLNGYEAARRIREQPRHKRLTLVALTGWGQAEDKSRSKEAGFDAHLVKPVDLAALTTLLSRAAAN